MTELEEHKFGILIRRVFIAFDRPFDRLIEIAALEPHESNDI